MISPRETVCRSFKNQERKFLNYDSQQKVSLGDIVFWDGWRARYTQATSLKNLNIAFTTHSTNALADERISSRKGVDVNFEVTGDNEIPTMNVKLKGSSCYSMQTYKSILTSIDTADLALKISNSISSNGLEWNKKWIVVTDLWEAEAYTKVVSGGRKAEAWINAAPGLVDRGFNIADVSLDVNLGYQKRLATQEVASSGAIPFFIGRKYRTINQQKCMVSYGGIFDDFMSLFNG